VHDDTKLTILHIVMRLMGMKLKYNFSNQCYNDVMKLIIDLILSKHNMPKGLYQLKNIFAGLGMNYEKIDVCERNCSSRRRTRTILNVCIAVDPDT
jgi:hypothetical protein